MIYGKGSNLADLAETVSQTAGDLQKHADKFDFIAVRGHSGIVVGSPVSLAIGKPLVIVRKPQDDCHDFGLSRTIINWQSANGRYIFLDDFISSGRTLHAVQDALSNSGLVQAPEFVGSYCYQNEDFPFIWESETEAVAA